MGSTIVKLSNTACRSLRGCEKRHYRECPCHLLVADQSAGALACL